MGEYGAIKTILKNRRIHFEDADNGDDNAICIRVGEEFNDMVTVFTFQKESGELLDIQTEHVKHYPAREDVPR